MPFQIKIIRPDMLEEAHRLDLRAWGEDGAAKFSMMEKRVERYPLGNFAAVSSVDGRIVGTVWSVAIDKRSITTWADATGNGEYDTCNYFGEMGFGVNVAVHPDFADQGLGNKLIEHVVVLAFHCGREDFRFGGRMPEYHSWYKVFTPNDYPYVLSGGQKAYFRHPEKGTLHGGVDLEELKSAGKLVKPAEWSQCFDEPVPILEALDEGVRFFRRVSVKGKNPRIIKVQQDYFPDADSHNYGVIMGWSKSDF